MRVNLDLPFTQAPSDPAPASTTRAAQSSSGTVKSPAQEFNKEAPLIVAAVEQTNVTFRRDSNGRIYYVVSNAQSGREIEEVPPASVRSVAEGIDAYLKQAQNKGRSPLDTKG